MLRVAQGKTSWEAGRILGIAEGTMNAHVTRPAERPQASNRAHLVARAFVMGILVPALTKGAALVLVLAFAIANHDGIRVRRASARRVRDDHVTEVYARAPCAA